MPRSRNIKYSFFTNDTLAEIDPIGRLFFIGLWTIADYKGDVEWREKKIKALVLPYDNCNIKKIAINLDSLGFIRFFSDGDKIYLNVVNFCSHQNPHKNEKQKGSSIPCFSESMRQAVDLKGLTINRDLSRSNHDENGTAPADSCILIPDSCILIPREKHMSDKPDLLDIFEYWKLILQKNNTAKFTDKRKAKIKARLNDGYTVDQIKQAIDGCAKSAYHMGENDSGTIYDDLTLICRSGEKLEFFINNIGKVSRETNKPSNQKLSLVERVQQNSNRELAKIRDD